MSTTRPIGGSEPIKEVGNKRVQQTTKSDSSAPVERAADAKEAGSATVAESVQTTRRLMEVAQEEFNRSDKDLIEELKAAIKEGRFKVDPDRLAARLISDALGDFDESDS
jgi:flagellar biosynthesis anti-sigma factor FlgM